MINPPQDHINTCYDRVRPFAPVARSLAHHGVGEQGTALPFEARLGSIGDTCRNVWNLNLKTHMVHWVDNAWAEIRKALPYHHAWCVDAHIGLACNLIWYYHARAVRIGVDSAAQALFVTRGDSGIFSILGKSRSADHAATNESWGRADANLPTAARLCPHINNRYRVHEPGVYAAALNRKSSQCATATLSSHLQHSPCSAKFESDPR